jgi:hypothetical protein
MSKQWVALRLKDMYAIKHALQLQVKSKEKRLEELENIPDIPEKEQLVQDISHESWLAQNMENEILEFREANNIH